MAIPVLSRRWLLALAIVDLALRLAVALRPLAVIDGHTIPDDAYISLDIARNIARGLGPWYTDAHTNGFQPLYVFLMVPVFWMTGSDPVVPVRAALVLLTLFDVATLWLLLRLVSSFAMSRWTTLLAAAAWIGNPYVIRTTLNGLETAIAVFFQVWALVLFAGWRRTSWLPSRARAVQLGAVLGFAALARIDSWLLAATLAVVAFVCNRRRLPQFAPRVAIAAGAALAVYASWLVYSYAYTGDVYPVSGAAVRFGNLDSLPAGTPPGWRNWYGPMLATGLRTIGQENWPCLLVIVTLGVVMLARRRPWPACVPAPLLAAVSSFAILLLLAYTLYQFGTWYFERYLYPVVVLLVLGLAALFEGVVAGSARAPRMAAVAIAAGLLVGFWFHPARVRLTLPSRQKNRMGYMQVALWAARTFPAGTVLGAPQSGALGYFATDLRVVNLDGVVNKECLRSIIERRNLEYMRSAGVRWVLGWRASIALIAVRSPGGQPGELVLRAKVPELESWGHPWYIAEVMPKPR